MIYLLLCLVLVFPGLARAQTILSNLPEDIQQEATYIIYSHGRIVEGNNLRPISSQWGQYLFPEVQQALVDDTDWFLISEQRSYNADTQEYAEKIASWVTSLISAGVSANRVTLLGFSKGGYITALASSLVSQFGINTILLATCGDWIPESVQLQGNLLSIIETSDPTVESCQDIADRSKSLASFEEINISTGREHGAFFQPHSEWLQPVKAWIEERESES